MMKALVSTLALAALVGPRLMSARSPQVVGDVAVIDATGLVAVELGSALSPEAIEERRTANARRAVAQAAPGIENLGPSERAIREAVGRVPMLTLRELPADADPQREKGWLTAPVEAGQPHLALGRRDRARQRVHTVQRHHHRPRRRRAGVR